MASSDNLFFSCTIGLRSQAQLFEAARRARRTRTSTRWRWTRSRCGATEAVTALMDGAASAKQSSALVRLLEESIEASMGGLLGGADYIGWDFNGLLNARRGFLADARLLHYELQELARAKGE